MAQFVTDNCVDLTGKDLRKCKKPQRKVLKKEFRALAKETCCKSKDDDDELEPEVLAQVAQDERPEIDCEAVK